MAETLVSDPSGGTGLIQRAQAWSDMQDDFIRPLQWVASANFWHKRLSVFASRLGYPLNETDVALTFNGAASYTVPEPLALMATFFVRPDGTYKKLERLNPVQKRFTGTTVFQGDPKQYHVKRSGSNIVFDFFPVPSSGTGVAMVIPAPATLTIDSSVNYPLGWEEYIVLHMAKFALAKEETRNPMIDEALSEVTSHIEDAAASYLMTDGAKVRDIREDDLYVNYNPQSWLWF